MEINGWLTGRHKVNYKWFSWQHNLIKSPGTLENHHCELAFLTVHGIHLGHTSTFHTCTFSDQRDLFRGVFWQALMLMLPWTILPVQWILLCTFWLNFFVKNLLNGKWMPKCILSGCIIPWQWQGHFYAQIGNYVVRNNWRFVWQREIKNASGWQESDRMICLCVTLNEQMLCVSDPQTYWPVPNRRQMEEWVNSRWVCAAPWNTQHYNSSQRKRTPKALPIAAVGKHSQRVEQILSSYRA